MGVKINCIQKCNKVQQSATKLKSARNKNATKLKHFVAHRGDVINVEISTEIAVTVTTKSATKSRHFVALIKPVISKHTAILYAKCNSFLGLKLKK